MTSGDTYSPAASSLTVQTTDGLRVALAGLPASMPVRLKDGLDLNASTVGEARKIDVMPEGGLSIAIPYRLLPDSVVTIGFGGRQDVTG